jgi:dihydrolipoamide dehydrogenase
MADNSFDLVVIGGGPGGYVAAIRAAQLGMKTALIERDQLGGICLNWGCIPTKALLRASEIHHLLHHLDQFGFSAKDIAYDPKKVIARSRAVAKQLSNGVAHLMRKNKITVFDGQAKLAGKGKVAVTKDGKPVADLAAPHIVLATGARARSLPGLEPDGKLVWTYKEAMVPEAIPKSLLVVGSGAIGMEFASFYRDMGAEVTVVEVLDRVLPVEDEEISAFARKAFEKQEIKIHTGATVKELKRGADRSRWQNLRHHRRARHPGGRHRRQCRGCRPRRHQGQGGSNACHRRRMAAHRRARALRDRRPGRAALAGA